MATRRVLLALLLVMLGSPALAADSFRLAEHCRILAEPGLSPQQAATRLDKCQVRAPRDAFGTLWIDYRDVPMLAEPNQVWRLTLDNHRTHAVEIWLKARQAGWRKIIYDPDSPTREWATANYFSVPFFGHQPIDRILVRTDSAESMTYIRAPRLTNARAFATIDRNQAAGYGIAVGMLALTILFHLSLFFAIRRRFQLIYAAHVALLFIYALCFSGIIRLVAPDLSALGVSRLLNFVMIAGATTGVAFVLDFLGPRAVSPGWRRWAILAGAGSLVSAVLVALVPQQWSSITYTLGNVASLHTILVTAAILVRAISRRDQTAVLLGVGWLLPMAVSLLYPARNFGLVPDWVIPDGLMLFAVTLECLILSLPVATRIRKLRIDHERAQERHAVLERQAQTDALTGLANRRGFGDALTRAAAAQAEPTPIAVLVIDIDHFKRVNDQHGHGTGDAILQHVAAHVARVASSGAIVARYGGEEFVVALRGYDLMRASTLAERIRATINMTFDAEPALPGVTISIGVAAGLTNQIETLLEDADCALYRAKNEGRDRVMLADGPLMYAAAA